MISTENGLEELLISLEKAPWIAIDTEADSLYAYPERLCLLQISIPDQNEIVDPLSDVDLSPLWSVLSGRELILHGSDFDLRLLRKTVGFVPMTVFDTMIAARLVGARQFGLAALVERHIGPTLSKGPQKANWAQRPLPKKLVDYAVDDTRYLKPLSDVLRTRLERSGRLQWHRECCDRLIAECSQPPTVDPDKVWRLKGSARLNPQGLAALRALWHWREGLALTANRPPYFIISHEDLVDLAETSQRTPADKLRTRRRMSRSRIRLMRSAVSEAIAASPSDWPERADVHSHVGRATRGDASKLKQRRNRIAETLGIDPTLIANRDTLERLAGDWDLAVQDLLPWQRELLESETTP